MQSPVPEKLSFSPPSSPLNLLSNLSLRVRRSSLPSPTKIKPCKSGSIRIENPGFFKSSYEYQLPDQNLNLTVPMTQEITRSICVEDSKLCRICLGGDNSTSLITPCACTGSQKYVHEECLKTWLLRKSDDELNRCELCKQEFNMLFEVTSACMPFQSTATCRAWIPCIICFALLAAIIYLCMLSAANHSDDIPITIGGFFLAIFWITCCIKSIFAVFKVCFKRKIDVWTISNVGVRPE